MSPASPAWTVIGVLLALGAVALLYRRSRPRGGQHGEGAAYRWLAAAAAAWGAAFAVQVAGVGSVTPTAIQLSLTDLLALLGLPPLVMGLIRLAPPDDSGDAFDRLADGALLSLGIFAMAWIAILRPAYASVAVGAGSFAVDLVHPLADLVVLGGTLAVALRAGRAALAPYLAVVAATLGRPARSAGPRRRCARGSVAAGWPGSWRSACWAPPGSRPRAPLPPTCGARPACRPGTTGREPASLGRLSRPLRPAPRLA